MEYQFIYNAILKGAKDNTKLLQKIIKEKKIEWLFQVFIDASHSGAAITKAEEWAKKLSKTIDPLENFPDYIGDGLYVTYFKDVNCFLQIDTFTSCRND